MGQHAGRDEPIGEERQQSRSHHHRLSRWVSMLDVMNPSEVLGHHAGRAESNTFRLSLDGGVSTTMLSSSPTVAMGQHVGRDEPIGGVSMLDVMNPSEVLGHHAGRAESNTFRLSLDGGVSTTMLSSSPTVAMGQHAGRDEPIGGVSMLDVMNPSEVLGHHAGRAESNTFRLSLDGGVSTTMLSSSPTVAMGVAKMVHLKDFVDGKRRYLALVDREDDLPKSGTCLAVRPSLLRPGNKADSLVNSQNFRKSMSTVIKLDNMDAYVLHNMMPDRDATNDKPPLLGRSIVSGATKWKSNTVKFIGDFFFIPGYWEWTEDVLSRYGDILELCSVRDAVYASFYSYDRDTNILRAFCESWCPSTNTLHTMAGEFSISLWDLYKLGGLPISGRIYDETVPDIHTLRAHTDKGVRRIPKAYESLLAAYRQIVQRPEYTGAPPKSTHNPSGKLADPPSEWSTKELHLFNSLGIEAEGKRETTYVAAFLSCWLCVFVLPENEDRLIRPGTFEVAVLMARGETFSLAIPVLASIYRGLNVISRSPNPSYSGAYFPAHYLYGWLGLYFNTNHAVDPSPPGPLMVSFSGAQGSKFFKDVEARRVIHEGSGAKVGCTMLNKNKNIFLFDDGNLDHTQMSYLSSLRSGYVSLRHYDSFFIEPYLPYRFSRQFGFCQDIPSAITRKVQDRSNVSYEKVLMFWKLLLFQGSMSRVCAPCLSLDWHKLKTVKFHRWWTKVTIKDLRHNIDKLCSAVESSSPNLKRVSAHDEARDAHRSADGHASRHEGTGDNVCAAPPRRLHLTGVLDEVEGEDKSTSDAESEINFKHQRGRRSKKPRTADLEGDETDFRNAFENIPIPSDIPIDLNQVGDMDFEMGASFNIDDAMMGEATEPLNVLTDRPNPGKGKDIHMERDLVERSNSASPVQTHHSVDGPSTFEINAKTLCIPLDAKGIPRAPSHGDAAPAPPISTIRVTPASQGIFTSAIRILGNEYLTLLKQTPFDKVSERHGEAPQVYKAIRVMHGDPEPLKCKVDEYVWAVKSHLALKASLSDRRRSDQVEEERLAIEKELRLAESKLEDVHQRIDQVANDLDDNRNSLTTLEATVHTTKRRVEELEAVPVCNAEEMELFEEQERKLLEFQSSLDICEWMV
ncbi:Tropomyosin-1 [Bienertia sinuspersici]